MDPQTAIAIVAAVIAGVSAAIAAFQVREMRSQTELQRTTSERQTELQRTISEQAAQPYIWADVQLQEANGFLLEFVLGNSGPTVATDVRVTVDPRFANSRIEKAVYDKLRDGLASLAPGRILRWSLGGSPDVLKGDDPKIHTITIDATGPYGRLPRNEFVIDMADWLHSVARREGTLHQVAEAVTKLDKHLPIHGRALDVRVETDHDG